MKNSAVLAAISKQFPDAKPDDINVEFLASIITDDEIVYEFKVNAIHSDPDESYNYIFKCSLTEI